jgi:hypothetical protein
MNMRLLRGLACFVWMGAAASSAAPANATAVTLQVGNYASCSANYSTAYKGHCGGNGDPYMLETYFTQTIKFVSQGCNTGGCAGIGSVSTDFVYPTGRKVASGEPSPCGPDKYWYELGTCSC